MWGIDLNIHRVTLSFILQKKNNVFGRGIKSPTGEKALRKFRCHLL